MLNFIHSGGNSSETTAPTLSDFAQYVLREICNQEWVLDRCLKKPETLCRPDMLLDQMLTPKQAQRLLHMICYPEIAASTDNCLDHKTIINNIIQVSGFILSLKFSRCSRCYFNLYFIRRNWTSGRYVCLV